MKILMILEYQFPGDVRVDKEVETLHNAGHTVDVAIYSSDSNVEYKKEYVWGSVYSVYISKVNYKLSALALELPFYFRFWEKFLEGIIKQNEYDYIHLHDLPLIKVAYKLSKKFSLPLIADLHENRPEILKYYKHIQSFPGKYLISIKRWIKYQIEYVNKVDKVILITEEAKKYYVEHYGVDEDKIIVVPNYVDYPVKVEKADKDLLSLYRSKKTMVYFGDVSLRRGVLEIVELANHYKNNNEYHFVIIGGGSYLTTLKNKILEYNLSNIDVLGFVESKKAMDIINSCSVGTCPFHRNIHHDTTYANKMFQFMGLGLPIIVSDCTAQANVVYKDKPGVVFEAGNVSDFIEKYDELMSDEEEFIKIGFKNMKLVEDKYSWKVAEKELLKIYSR